MSDLQNLSHNGSLVLSQVAIKNFQSRAHPISRLLRRHYSLLLKKYQHFSKKILILHNWRENTWISCITYLGKEATFHARKVHVRRYILLKKNWIITCFCHSLDMINNSYGYWMPSLENRFALPVCSTEISIFVALYFYYFNSKIANESKTSNIILLK